MVPPPGRHGIKLAATAIFSGIGVSFLPERLHPALIKQWNGFYVFDEQLHAKVPAPVPPRLADLLREEARKIAPEKDYVMPMDPYIALNLTQVLEFDLDLLVVTGYGCLSSGKGAAVGIPFPFVYADEEVEIEEQRRNLRRFLETGMKFPSEALADSFASALLLSENARRYAISRTLREISYDHFRWKSGALLCGAVSGAALWFIATVTNEAFARNTGAARSLGVFCLAIALIIFVSLRALTVDYVQRNADESCVKMGRDYIDGGREFYEKMILANKLMARIDENYRRKINVYGNETTWFTLNIRTVHRFDHFLECCRREEEEMVVGAVEKTDII